jgi:hypothetical protein
MKKILLIISFAVLSAGVSAQSVNFGVKAGLNLSTLSVSPSDPGYSSSNKTGYHFGVVADIPIREFSLQPGLYYITKGQKFSSQYTFDFGDGPENMVEKGSLRLDYIELPVNLLYNLKVTPDIKIYIGAGGYLAYGLAGKLKGTISGDRTGFFDDNVSFSGNQSDHYKNPDYGLNFIVGERLKHFSIDVNYSLGLANITPNGQGANVKNSAVGISLGYWFK